MEVLGYMTLVEGHGGEEQFDVKIEDLSKVP
jgi:hypothetical protein